MSVKCVTLRVRECMDMITINNQQRCRCSGYRGIPVHLLLGPVIGPSSAQGRINDPRYGEDPREEAPHEENDGGNC
jgi:hypothetical protein